jgi:hypothetical protein
MTADDPRVSVGWLALREPADAAARAPELVEPIRRHLAGRPRAVIHDLGGGTGSMGRWLAPRLAGPQHWITYDRDADLLAHLGAGTAPTDADGTAVTVEARLRDITRLPAGDLDGAALITASALLDMLTADEVERIVAACAGAGCPTLMTGSVIGQVEFTPADPLDAELSAAFNAHQRRTLAGRSLLGPDAVDATVDAFHRRGMGVRVRPGPWRLGADHPGLIAEWLTGWVGAACAQRPDLAGPAAGYLRRRRAELAAGHLQVVIHHTDLLAGCD